MKSFLTKQFPPIFYIVNHHSLALTMITDFILYFLVIAVNLKMIAIVIYSDVFSKSTTLIIIFTFQIGAMR